MYTGIVNAYGSSEIIRKNLPWIIDLLHLRETLSLVLKYPIFQGIFRRY